MTGMTGITRHELNDELRQFIENTEESSGLIPPLVQQQKWNRAFNETTVYAYPIADGLWDDLDPGIYTIAVDIPQSLKNKGIYPYGLLIVRGLKEAGRIQIYFPHTASSGVSGGYVYRNGGWNSPWNLWSIIPSEVELNIRSSADITLLNGFTGQAKYFRDMTGNVTVSVSLSNTPTNEPNTVIGMLPSGFRPISRVSLTVMHANTMPYGNYSSFTIYDDGRIAVAFDNKILAGGLDSALVGSVTFAAKV